MSSCVGSDKKFRYQQEEEHSRMMDYGKHISLTASAMVRMTRTGNGFLGRKAKIGRAQKKFSPYFHSRMSTYKCYKVSMSKVKHPFKC